MGAKKSMSFSLLSASIKARCSASSPGIRTPGSALPAHDGEGLSQINALTCQHVKQLSVENAFIAYSS